MIKLFYALRYHYRINFLASQAHLLSFSLCLVLMGCQLREVLPREIEVLDDRPSLSYLARLRYERALFRLSSMPFLRSGVSDAPPLELRISGACHGLKDGRTMRIKPRSARLVHNRCLVLALLNEDETEATPLQICYTQGKLWIDPNPDDKKNRYLSSLFYPSAMWALGAPMTKVNTSGVASLHQATIRIRQLEK